MVYILRGELGTMCNGLATITIIEIVYKTKKEADTAKEERLNRYKNLKVIKRSDENLY